MQCAPILGYMRGWSQERVLRYVRSRRWTVEQIDVSVKHPVERWPGGSRDRPFGLGVRALGLVLAGRA